jgi:hypothetical protein
MGRKLITIIAKDVLVVINRLDNYDRRNGVCARRALGTCRRVFWHTADGHNSFGRVVASVTLPAIPLVIEPEDTTAALAAVFESSV